MTEKIIKNISLVCLIALAIFLCFFNHSKQPAQVWDEQTNINVVNETQDPLDLKLDEESFFEKPPLWYWGTMGATELLGENNASYRFLSALAGVGIVLVVYFISKNIWGHWTGIISGFSILSIGHLFINNVSGYFSTHTFRSADLDALQIFFIITAIYFYLQGRDVKSYVSTKIARILMFLFSALAIMTKGPIGFLPIVILLFSHPNIKALFVSSRTSLRDLSIFKNLWQIIKTHHLLPFSIFSLIILPWHIWMYVKFGTDFIDKYFLYHMVKRATETIEEHNEDFLFYIRMFGNINVFAVGIPTLAGIFIAIKNKLWQKNIGVKVAMLGFFIPLILFTLVPTKLAWYNLYVYPFAAMLTGWLFSQKWENKHLDLIKNATIVILIVVGIVQNVSWVLSL